MIEVTKNWHPTIFVPEAGNQHNLRVWLGALYSGDYEKGIGKMHYIEDGVHKWCCLGVACDVSGQAEWHQWARPVNTNAQEIFDYKGEANYWPQAVRQWLGIESPKPYLFDGIDPELLDVRGISLIRVNDEKTQCTFPQIADLVKMVYGDDETRAMSDLACIDAYRAYQVVRNS